MSRLPASPAAASRAQLPAGPWPTVLDWLCERFAHVSRTQWLARMQAGLVQDNQGRPIPADAPYLAGLQLRYWRDAGPEPAIPGTETLLHVDADLVVVDKPHVLPVAPTGAWVEETLLRRVSRRLQHDALAPLHRLDRATAGIVLLSANPRTRALYHALFRRRAVGKVYEALAPPLPALVFPYRHASHLARGEPFFRMRESGDAPNSETTIDVIERGPGLWRYELRPATGRKHQLRVHMAALGAAIDGDPYYPRLSWARADDYERPLALLASEVHFTDPLTGERRAFRSALDLARRHAR